MESATPADAPVNRPRRRILALALALAGSPARANVSYPDVRPGPPLAFPLDEGAHPAFRNEWWYVTGWLRDVQARDFGFQVTFFRNRPGVAESSTSRFAPKQLLFAHAALANPEWSRLHFDQRAAREGFGLAAASTVRTDVHIGDWSLTQDGSQYAAHIRARSFAIDLVLDAGTPVLLQGDRGVSRKGPDPIDASYYYSRPQLAVSGKLAFDGRTRDVSGVAWLDHEWSSRYLPEGAVGWDWTGINFDDGGALMAFRIRDARGGALWAGGAWRDRQRVSRVLTPADVDFAPQRRWRSPRTGIEYPVSFQLRAGEVEVTLEPLFPDQELDARAGVGTVYWEGAMRAMRSGRAAGRGYLELTGYGEPLRI
ncbi:MAG: carotenoid 1,2-hydratase [Pseudomonadota bacterium]|nr:carotenoid 1,2-hydratase [Pseudomonadota bacterium]